MRSAGLTLLLMALMFAFGALTYIPDDLAGLLLLGVIVGVTFIVGFLRGHAIADRAWRARLERTAEQGLAVAALLEAYGERAPVVIVPGGHDSGFGRSL